MRRPASKSQIIEAFLDAYRGGAFPMADVDAPAPGAPDLPVADSINWYFPDPRAILPLDPGALHVPHAVARQIRKHPFSLTSDRAFEQVIRACARPGPTRGGPWLDETLVRCYCLMHEAGHAHSIEAWSGAQLVGGIYGVSIGATFFAESMFSDIERGGSGAANICLATLWNHLRASGFMLLDVQIANQHTSRFGIVEIAADDYLARLADAVAKPDRWRPFAA